jgi:hypothetical protein
MLQASMSHAVMENELKHHLNIVGEMTFLTSTTQVK